jgi:antitoxin HicB
MAKHIGSKFTDFLEEEGIKNDVDLLTLKKVLADEIHARMEKMNLGVSQFASRMRTGRDVAYRLLDANDTGVTLKTLSKAAKALHYSSIVEMLVTAGENAASTGKPRRQRPPARRRNVSPKQRAAR